MRSGLLMTAMQSFRGIIVFPYGCVFLWLVAKAQAHWSFSGVRVKPQTKVVLPFGVGGETPVTLLFLAKPQIFFLGSWWRNRRHAASPLGLVLSTKLFFFWGGGGGELWLSDLCSTLVV